MNSPFESALVDALNFQKSSELDFPRAIQLFETIYMASRNLAPKTRSEYKADITQLAEFLNTYGTVKLAEVSLSHLQTFLAYLDTKGITGITRRRKTASLRTFFKFLYVSGFLPNNPTRELIPPEREYKAPRFLTTQEYQALQKACSHNTRDAAIVELMLQTGIRLSETAKLTIHDVELPKHINRNPANTGYLHIQGKGKQTRMLPLNYKACLAVKEWLAVRPSIPNSALFVTKFQEPMGQRSIQQMIEKYLNKAAIQGASAHTLRHTFGTHHIAKGTPLKTVQETLGHADIKTTSIYLSLARNVMRRELQNHAL